mgnify:CR=1 FL=1
MLAMNAFSTNFVRRGSVIVTIPLRYRGEHRLSGATASSTALQPPFFGEQIF